MGKVMVAALAAGLGVGGGVMPVAAAAQNVEARVGKLESEMRAVQRKVFPGGSGQYLQPEITAPPSTATQPGSPATSAVADLSARVAAVESQLQQFTGQLEQAQYRQRQAEEQFAAYRRATDARLKALEAAPAPIAGGSASAPLDEPAPATSRPTATRPAATRPAARAATPPEEASDLVNTPAAGTVAKPSTGDGAEDGYLYGYRLWQAKRYTEAQGELKKVVAAYPKSRRASYAQNLLGRAYLDDGKPSLASMAFYENYKKMPDGERAPDSLLYLGQALVKLGKPADACKVYGELEDVYAAKLSATLQAQLAQGRTTAKCK